jgi:glycosyltransferase involved in cell wall biosynthesis
MEVMTRELLDYLAAVGEVDFVHVDTSISRSTSDRQALGPRKVLRLARQLPRSVRNALRASVVYYPISQSRTGLARDLVLLAPARVLGRRIVLHLHGSALHATRRRLPRWLRWGVDWLIGGPRTEAIVLTPALRQCFSPWLPESRIHVVPNLVRVPGNGSARSEPPPLRVLFIGNVDVAKGYRELVRAVSALARRGVEIELTLAGPASTADDGEWLERERSGSVAVTGPVDGPEKWRLLREAHVLTLPSRLLEGQPVSILEGMASGCAVVATRSGGISDTVKDGTEGLLIDLDPDELHLPIDRKESIEYSTPLAAGLERALARLAADGDLLRRLGEGARARFDAQHRPETAGAAWHAALIGSS